MPQEAVPIETDVHYGYIGLGSYTQSANDSFDANEIDEDIIAPDISLDAFGKGKHGMLCWDVREFVVLPPDLPIPTPGSSSNNEWGIEADNSREGNAPTAMVTPDEDEYIAHSQQIVEVDEVTGVGEIFRVNLQRPDRYALPQQDIGGNDFGLLLTAGHYWFLIDSNGTSAQSTWRVGMFARRCLVPLTEAFYDQRSVAELLLAAQVLQLN